MPLISSAETPEEQNRTLSPEEAMELLTAASPEDRRRAALALDGHASAHTDLARLLQSETDASVRAAILSSLSDIQEPAVTDLLIDILRGDDPSRRNEVVGLLQQLSDLVAQRIGELLQDEDPDVRIMTIDILRLLPHSDAPSWLRSHLEHETHPNVVGVIVDRLAEIGGPDDLPALTGAKERFATDPYICFAADHVIQRIQALAAEEETG